MDALGRTLLGSSLAGAAALGYAVGVERSNWALRESTLPVLGERASELRILHISDLHMLPGQERKQRWVAELDALEPDLVINTGDNLAHPQAVPAVLRALGPLLRRQGLFVFGSNDYFAPVFKNPLHYLVNPGHRTGGGELPWRDLRAALIEHGWLDMTHRRRLIRVGGQLVAAAGVDDPHLGYDRYRRVAGTPDPRAALRLGLGHSPEPRVLDGFAEDGYDLVLAGHTHGGQLRLPGYGALVTNCGIDRSRARGVSRWNEHTWLHVSAGLGTSPYAPARFACRPEASLLTLQPRPTGAQEPAAATGGGTGRRLRTSRFRIRAQVR